MKPTKEQLADPKWWDENANGCNYIYYNKSTLEFAPTLQSLNLTGDSWELLAKRPEPEWVPEVGVDCCGNTTDAAGNWSWQKVEPLKDMGNGEFACYTEKKILRFVDQFRPTKTQREELVDIINKHDGGTSGLLAKHILARFDLTKKDDE